jgi:hypothetical protein
MSDEHNCEEREWGSGRSFAIKSGKSACRNAGSTDEATFSEEGTDHD